MQNYSPSWPAKKSEEWHSSDADAAGSQQEPVLAQFAEVDARIIYERIPRQSVIPDAPGVPLEQSSDAHVASAPEANQASRGRLKPAGISRSFKPNWLNSQAQGTGQWPK